MVIHYTAAQVGTLEATKLSNEQSIKELHLEIKKLFSRCNDMEMERETANKKLSSHSTEASKQIQALQVVGLLSHICLLQILIHLLSALYLFSAVENKIEEM